MCYAFYKRTQTHTHTHTHAHTQQMLKDMGAELDRMTDICVNNGWKATKSVLGPLYYMLSCVHPDTAKVVLKGGTCVGSPIPPFCRTCKP